MTKIKAGSIHLVISVLIFIIIIMTLIHIWYPSPYFLAAGGWQGVKIVASVDLVLGPLLTFIIFNIRKSKKELFFDFSIIFFIQMGALVWGINNIYIQRPIAIVFWENRFMTVPANALNKQGIELKELASFGKSFPVYIYAKKPKSVNGLNSMLEQIEQSSIPPHHQVNLYEPLSVNYIEIRKQRINMKQLMAHDSDIERAFKSILDKTSADINDFDCYALLSKYHNIILMFNSSGELKESIVIPIQN